MCCSLCKAKYDLECINISPQRFFSFYMHDKSRRDCWKCPRCISIRPKSCNQNTPVHTNVSPEHSSNVTLRRQLTSKDLSDTSTDKIEDCGDHGAGIVMTSTVNFKELLEEMRAVRNEMSEFRSVMSDLKATINSQNVRLQALESRIEELESRPVESQSQLISNLEKTVDQLKLEIDERDQHMLGNDIEIANYPECNRNPTHVVLTVAKILGVEVGERDVVSAVRIGAPPASTADNGARPRPIVVRLACRDQRDALLRAARVRRRVTVPASNESSTSVQPRQFYINERLTRRNRQLFLRAREAAKRLNWKFVWSRDGKIFARHEHGGERYRLRSEGDLATVFGSNFVGDVNQSAQ
jgi:hypothetical protein